MEYERSFKSKPELPTGFDYKRKRRPNLKAIPESQYEGLRKMRDDGVEIKEISRLMGYSPYCIASTLKRIDGLK